MMQPRGNLVLNSSCALLFFFFLGGVGGRGGEGVCLAVKYHKVVDVSLNPQNDIFNITAETDD